MSLQQAPLFIHLNIQHSTFTFVFQLTTSNVLEVVKDSLFKEGEDTSKAVMARSVIHGFGFHPDRLEANRQKVRDMLSQLPDSFMSDKGGGMSFLNACVTKNGEQWGEHSYIDMLFTIGQALGMVVFPIERELWSTLPGGLPYVTVYLDGLPKTILGQPSTS